MQEYFDLLGCERFCGGGIKARTFREYTKMPGGLPCIKVSRKKILVKKSDLVDFLERHRENPVNIDDVVNDVLADLKVSRRKR